MKLTLVLSTAALTALGAASSAFADSWEAPTSLPPAAIIAPFGQSGEDIILRIATGGKKGMYYPAGEVLSAFSPSGVQIERLATDGSWDNVARAINGEVQLIVAQPDTIALLEREYPQYANQFSLLGTLHTEYAQVICNREENDFYSVAGNLEDAGVSLAIVNKDSGANLMFGNWIAEDSGYSRTDIRYYTGDSASSDAVTAVKSGAVDCLLLTRGLSASLTQDLDSDEWRKLRLVSADDSDLNDAKDADGNRLYDFVDFPEDALTGLDLWDTDDRSSWDLETVSWRAGVYAFMPAFTGSAGAEAYDALIRSVTLAGPAMQAAEDAAVDLQ
jgi:TRAP-type uncharacterized transport system substrate-binding protein